MLKNQRGIAKIKTNWESRNYKEVITRLAFLCGSFWETTKGFLDNLLQGQNEKEPMGKIRSIGCIQNVFVLLPCLYLNSSSLECYPRRPHESLVWHTKITSIHSIMGVAQRVHNGVTVAPRSCIHSQEQSKYWRLWSPLERESFSPLQTLVPATPLSVFRGEAACLGSSWRNLFILTASQRLLHFIRYICSLPEHCIELSAAIKLPFSLLKCEWQIV